MFLELALSCQCPSSRHDGQRKDFSAILIEDAGSGSGRVPREMLTPQEELASPKLPPAGFLKGCIA